jgi:hypothetical protein
MLQKLSSAINLDGASVVGTRRLYHRDNGIRFRVAKITCITYREMLVTEGALPYDFRPIPGPDPNIFLGFNAAADRSLVITYFGVPGSWSEDDLRTALRTSGCPTPSSMLRTRQSHTTGHWSWRTGFGSVADADTASGIPIVVVSDEGLRHELGRWHHLHDFGEGAHGAGADVMTLMTSIVARNPVLGAGPCGLIIGKWCDGVALKAFHRVSGLVWVISDDGCTPLQRLFEMRGSDADSVALGGSASFLLQLCHLRSPFAVLVQVHDHLMAFQSSGVRAGGKDGYRSPYVVIQGMTLYSFVVRPHFAQADTKGSPTTGRFAPPSHCSFVPTNFLVCASALLQ